MLQTTTDGKKTSWKKRKLIHYNMIHFWFVTYTYLVIQLIWPIIFLPKSFIVRKVKPGGDWVCQIVSHEPPRFKHFTLLTDWDIKGALVARCFRTEGLLNSAGRLSNFAYKNSSLTSFLCYLSTNLLTYMRVFGFALDRVVCTNKTLRPGFVRTIWNFIPLCFKLVCVLGWVPFTFL